MLTVLVAVLESGSMERWLAPKAGLEQLFPGDFGQLLRAPERVVVEGLTDATNDRATPFGPDEAKFTVGSRQELSGALRQSVLALLSKPTRWKTQDHRQCAPGRCVFVMRCGGFRPSVQLWLEKGARSARVLLCLDCSEAWVDRFDADGRRVGREQAMIEPRDEWRKVLLPAVLPASQSTDAGM